SNFTERVAGWLEKALREAKRHSDWVVPNEQYERDAHDFMVETMSPSNPRFPLLRDFAHRIAAAGALNGLVQAALKLTVPGMPDIFQGTEFWDLSLVDPDNRRPVDFESRRKALAAMAVPADAAATWRDGRVKQSLIRKLLGLRADMPALFARGEYTKLAVSGSLADHVIAYARRHADDAVIVLAPRLAKNLLKSEAGIMLDPDRLQDSAVALPAPLAGRSFTNILAPGSSQALGSEQALAPLLSSFPIAVLRAG
ncbi:MAG: malto-oligosyltrehalose synthase, partial [Rhodopila sp.]